MIPSLEQTRVAIVGLGYVGLGYVGLPLAVELGDKRAVVGFDINAKRIAELQAGHNHTLGIDQAKSWCAGRK